MIGRPLLEALRVIEQGSRVALGEQPREPRHLPAIDRRKHRPGLIFGDLTAAEGEQLIEQGETIAHAAVGGLGDELHRRVVEGDALRAEDGLDARADQRHGEALEVELQAAREHRDRQLLRVGGREQELHMRRRFFERLQQRVEGVRREHVDFVDEVDLVPAAGGRVLHVLEQLARVVDLGARGRIDFDEIDEPAFIDLATGGAFPARGRPRRHFAIEALGEDARDGGLAHAAGAGEEEGVMDAVGGERVGERLQHMLLAGELLEALGAPFTGECGVAHRVGARWTRLKWEAARTSLTPAPDRTATVAPFRAWRN